ncbi:MAG TPA: hypothetical protein PKB06_01895, partial [Actinotalea sp.]|nr:hypothetical protein [Actinotalea sp.]
SVPGVAVVTDADVLIVSGVGWFSAPAHFLLDGVLLAGSPEVTAWALPSGDPLWTAAGTAAFSDGTLVGTVEEVAGGASVVARDLHSGAEVWRIDAPRACPELVGLGPVGVVLGGCGTVALVGPARTTGS